MSMTGPDGRIVGDATAAQVAALERRLSLAQGEVDTANAEIGQLTEELDFYRQLLGAPSRSARDRPGGGSTD